MWEWLTELSGGAAVFVGSATGSFFGLITILAGALFNARLNRGRDDRIRKAEALSVAAALRGELASAKQTLNDSAEKLDDPQGDFRVPDLSHSIHILPEITPKLGLLDPETVKEVINAYTLIYQYSESLMQIGGEIKDLGIAHRRLIEMPEVRAPNVAAMNRNMALAIERAEQKLDQHIA